jgi:hypothetical protein
MKLTFRLLVVVLMLGTMPARAADLFLSLKAGAFELQHNTFSSGTYGTVNVDTQSTASGALGMEWLLRDRWMVGFELYKTQHDWKAVVGGETGQIETRLAMFTGKRLFNTKSVVQPYLAGGIGLMYMDFNTGDSWDNEVNVGGHLGAGVLFKFDSVALYAEMRHFENLSTFAEYEYAGAAAYGGLRFEF